MMETVDSIDDIFRQARQGSVAAIIQILNEKLADSGVRTRAVLDHGVLQLLCEALSPEQLEQTPLVERIRQILQSISPRNIHRINVNSRLVREQQLMWLQEVQRDPDGQLLWSQEILLSRLNPLKRLTEDWHHARLLSIATPVANVPKEAIANQQFWRGMMIGGASLGLLLLLVGWAMFDWLGLTLSPQIGGSNAQISSAPSVSPSPTVPDPFVQAVRLAEAAGLDGREAATRAEWLDLASRWQRASDLMDSVIPNDNRFATAQNRAKVYQDNSRTALQKADSLR